VPRAWPRKDGKIKQERKQKRWIYSRKEGKERRKNDRRKKKEKTMKNYKEKIK
jgi:hypothetical protein